MNRPGETDTGGRHWVAAPSGTAPLHSGTIQGVWLNPGEEVQWHWCFSPDGNYVSGYSILLRKSDSTCEVEKVVPMGGFTEPIRVQITEGAWKGQKGTLARGIRENGSFTVKLDDGMQTAFHPTEFVAADDNPPMG